MVGQTTVDGVIGKNRSIDEKVFKRWTNSVSVMGKYRCSRCKTIYSGEEYLNLEKTSRVTDDPNDQYGVETVCECGKRFHSDKWKQVTDIETEDDGEVKVSTVALTIAHGLHNNHWYETCLFHKHGSNVVRRYETQEEAEKGHEEVVFDVENGEYSFGGEVFKQYTKDE